MDEKIKVLILEDIPVDAELVEREFKKTLKNYSLLVTDNEKGFIDALKNYKPDLILSDYSLPQFDGMEAIKLTKEISPLIPVIIVTGSINEEIAVECMRAGAVNYVIKENLLRLGPAITQSLEVKALITKRLDAEESLKLITERLQISTESAHIGIWDFDIENNSLIWDKQMFELYGIQPEDFGGAYETWEKGVHPEDIARSDKEVQDAISGKKDFHTQFRVVWPDGQIRSIEAHAIVISDSTGIPERMIGANWDITERKNFENKLKTSLKEKEILLQELYHRTKNNMQVVTSMLHLRAESLDNQQITEIFKEVENSILCMALLHQKLYESGDLSNLNLKEYIEGIVQILTNNLIQPSKQIDISVKGADIVILLDTAMPIGFIINEIVTNAIKHAFPNGRKGKIDITLNITPQNEIILAISDNGIGLPDNFDTNANKGFGMQIITDLVEYQLRGSISFKSNKGLYYQIVIKEEGYKARI